MAMSAFHLEMLEINNEERKNELVENAAISMHRMANILLTGINVSVYNPHNLVHHMDVLKELCSVEVFAATYKRLHKCGREPEPYMDLYHRRFPSESTAAENQAETALNNRPVSPQNQNTAVAAAQQVPPTTGNKHASTGSTARNLFPPSNKPTKTAPNEFDQNALAMVLALSKDDQKIRGLLEANPRLKSYVALGDQLNSKEGGLVTKIASKIAPSEVPQIALTKEVLFTRKGHDSY